MRFRAPLDQPQLNLLTGSLARLERLLGKTYATITKTGTAATVGTVMLIAGVGTVETTAVTSTCGILLTHQGGGLGTPGSVRVSSMTSGQGFTIQSTESGDYGTVFWQIVEMG